MVAVAQLVRVVVCGAIGRRFESGQPPNRKPEKTRVFWSLFSNFKLFCVREWRVDRH